MSYKVITTVLLNGLPKGTILQACKEVVWNGVKYWEGLHCSMGGSYMETVEQQYCEIYDPEKHDPMYAVRKYLAERNEINVEKE